MSKSAELDENNTQQNLKLACNTVKLIIYTEQLIRTVNKVHN